jgi:hypothetical protein
MCVAIHLLRLVCEFYNSFDFRNPENNLNHFYWSLLINGYFNFNLIRFIEDLLVYFDLWD